MFQLTKDSDNIVTWNIHRKDTPMNVIDDAFAAAFEQELEKLQGMKPIAGLIITSDKPEFVAGADLNIFLKLKSVQEVDAIIGRLQRMFRKLETIGFPVVAAINGVALGGGFEVCLACHYRIAIDSPKGLIGLPEVTLGLLPGAGGTQRLPRLIGFEKALPLMTQGAKLKPAEALAAGLIHALAKDTTELLQKSREWILSKPVALQPWDQPKFRPPGGDIQSPRAYQVFPAAMAMYFDKTHGNYPAPKAILSCVYEGLPLSIEQGCDIERKAISQLAQTPETQMMIRSLFFGLNECNKGVSRPKTVPKKEFKSVGILGAGMMGAGIAYASAKAGLKVILKDVSEAAATKGKGYSEKILQKEIEKGRTTPAAAQEFLARITPTESIAALKEADIIIEAVFEDRALKAKVTKETEDVISPDVIFGSNTSTLPITGLSENSSRPKNFIGIHFFSPVDKMQLVEVILGKNTEDVALAHTLDFIKKIGKTPIVVNDGRGFYTSRVFKSYVEEGIVCLTDGIRPALIENAGVQAGMPVGPLCVADEVSLDLMYHILSQTKKDLGAHAVDPQVDRVSDLFVNHLKRLGRKTSAGFYDYPSDKKKQLWPKLQEHFPHRNTFENWEEIQQRLLWRQVVETLKCFEEGVLTHPRDADIGSIFGWGFPAFTGGALSFVDFVGAGKFLEVQSRLAQKFGARFQLSEGIVKRLKSQPKAYDSFTS